MSFTLQLFLFSLWSFIDRYDTVFDFAERGSAGMISQWASKTRFIDVR